MVADKHELVGQKEWCGSYNSFLPMRSDFFVRQAQTNRDGVSNHKIDCLTNKKFFFFAKNLTVIQQTKSVFEAPLFLSKLKWLQVDHICLQQRNRFSESDLCCSTMISSTTILPRNNLSRNQPNCTKKNKKIKVMHNMYAIHLSNTSNTQKRYHQCSYLQCRSL